jgi:hypothetical protein
MSVRFSNYGLFVAAMGYSPADDAVIDTGGTSVWRISRNGNPCRFSADGGVRVTICETKNGIMYVANRGDQGQWHGPFPSFDAAIADADTQVFGD